MSTAGALLVCVEVEEEGGEGCVVVGVSGGVCSMYAGFRRSIDTVSWRPLRSRV